MTYSILSIGTILPTFAQMYPEPPSSAPSNAQQNQVKLTDKGSLMVGFYTDPEHPTVADMTSFAISFVDKDSQLVIPNIDYKVAIANNNEQVYETAVSHSLQGTAKVQYQFKEPGQYHVTVYVTGMSSQQISQETVSFAVDVGSSAVPEFPTSVAIVLAVALMSIVMMSARTRLRIPSSN